MVESLTKLLASSVVLVVKLRLSWWTALGAQQDALAGVLASEYGLLDGMCDEIAHALFLIGAHSPASYGHLREYSFLDDALPDTNHELLKDLAQDHSKLIAGIDGVEEHLSVKQLGHVAVLGLLRSLATSHEACIEGLDSEAAQYED